MDINTLLKVLLLLVPAGLFLYFDKQLLISNKVKAKFKITSFLGLYAFMLISILLSTFIVATLAMIFHLSSNITYGIQSMLIGALIGLFSNIQKLLRKRK